jgi:replicative superfamily II helicase
MTKSLTASWVAIESKNTKKLMTTNINLNSDVITLRDWQSEAFHKYVASTRKNFYINAPTGSGKSKAVMAIIAKALDVDTTCKIIIAVPQKAIGGGFATANGPKILVLIMFLMRTTVTMVSQ